MATRHTRGANRQTHAAGASPLASDFGAAVLDALPISLYIVDRDLRVVAWNTGREHGPQGKPRHTVLGRPLRRALSEAGFRTLAPLLRQVLKTGQPHEETSETPAGRRFHVRRLPVRQGSETTHVVSLFEDVTERSALELRLIASDRLAFLGQLVAGVAHEVSNPLAGIAGCAEVLASLASQTENAKARREAGEFHELIREEVARCERLVRTLLDAARPEGGRAADISATARTVLRLLDRHPAFARVRVLARLPGDLPQARIDPDSLRQVVVALAVNAAQAMPGGGTLSVRAGRFRGRLVLDVLDSGSGVPRALRAHIFEPFFRANTNHPGTGLGLAIARSLVRSRGGDLVLRSKRPPGAAFRVLLDPLEEAS